MLSSEFSEYESSLNIPPHFSVSFVGAGTIFCFISSTLKSALYIVLKKVSKWHLLKHGKEDLTGKTIMW